MNKRDYLRSLGFEVGERGRLSAEMLEALKDFYEDATQNNKPQRKILPASVKMRDDRTYMVELQDGGRVEMGFCSSCKESMLYCHCDGGPKPPSYLDSPIVNWYPVTSHKEEHARG
jgi:hypothetical protein